MLEIKNKKIMGWCVDKKESKQVRKTKTSRTTDMNAERGIRPVLNLLRKVAYSIVEYYTCFSSHRTWFLLPEDSQLHRRAVDWTKPQRKSNSLGLRNASISKDFAPLGNKYHSPTLQMRQLRNRTVGSRVSGPAPIHIEAPLKNTSSLIMKLHNSS